MEEAPPKADLLKFGHAFSVFSKGGNGKRVGKSEGGSGFGLEEDLMGDAAVLVFVTSSLPNALLFRQQLSRRGVYPNAVLTDLATGDVASDVGWNLNTPFAFSVKTLRVLPALSSEIAGLYCDEALVSVGLKGFARPDAGGEKAGEEPCLPIGKFSSIGDNECGSKLKAALAGELTKPSRPIPLPIPPSSR